MEAVAESGIPRWGGQLTTCPTDASRFRFESGALRTRAYNENGCQLLAGQARFTYEARSTAGFVHQEAPASSVSGSGRFETGVEWMIEVVVWP